MITNNTLQQKELDELYGWIDSITLSKQKKNISRDFSDAVLMAEVIAYHYPKIVNTHNYPPTSSVKSKIGNWMTLNNKVLSKIGLTLNAEDCKRLSNYTPLAIEALLFQFKKFVEQTAKEQENQNKKFPDSCGNDQFTKKTQNEATEAKIQAATKIEQLREVLSLIHQKILVVESCIERKDAQIRELQELLKNYH